MSDPAVCPYCRMPFDEKSPPKIFCTACGMPHHEDCYMENGGCTVFGCARAPAEEPKLQVSYSDLNAAPATPQPVTPVVRQTVASSTPLATRYGGPLGLSQPAAAQQENASGPQLPAQPAGAAPQAAALPGYAYAQPAPVQARSPKSRTTYIVLGVFLGAFGAHNFYAGYTGRAVGQLCLSVLTIFKLAVASWIWAIVEICIVDKDSTGLQFS
jgi:TM2 domain-containing membrane protein YozV